MKYESGTKNCRNGERIKVLHLVHAFQTGGAERVVLDLVRHGSPAVSNFVCSFQEPCDLSRQLGRKEAGFRCLNKGEGNDLRTIAALARLIDEESIDVVHAQGWGTFIEGLIASKLRTIRGPAFIYAFHGKTMDDVAYGVPLRRRLAQRIAHLWTDACIAPANHMADEYSRTVGVRRSRIELIHNGIDMSRFGRELHGNARASLGLTPDDFVVGFVGRLDPVKNIQGILEIFIHIRACLGGDKARARLILVGEGSARKDAERTVASRGLQECVVFAGLRADVAKCMAALDVYLQPSFYEGLSITILEAMATGIPVVSTAVGGTPEIISHGVNGLLYRPDEPGKMAEAIVNLYRDPFFCADLGRRGREHVRGLFSVTKMVEKYENLYRRVLDFEGVPCAA